MNRLIEQQSHRIQGITQAGAKRLQKMPGVNVILQTIQAYSEDRASLLAAALSYYTLLSLFPLMLFILAIVSPFLQSESAIRAVTVFIASYLPSSGPLLRQSLQEVTQIRGPLTIVAAGGFLWSASGVFDLLQLSINRAFCVSRARSMWRRRLLSLAMVVGVSLLFGLSFLMTTSLRLAVHYQILPRQNVILDYMSPIGSVLLGVFVFGLLYRYIPNDRTIRWGQVWGPALLVSLLWEAAKLVFAWYLTNIALLNLVYGSVGTVIAIMLWGFITASLLLMGAEMAAVRTGARERRQTSQEWWPQSTSAPDPAQVEHAQGN